MRKISAIITFYLISIFISTLVSAAELKVIWKGGKIPAGNAANPNGDLSCESNHTEDELNTDSTEEPSDVRWSDDGRVVFTTNINNGGKLNMNTVRMNSVSTPFHIMTDKFSALGGGGTCDDIDGINPNTLSGGDLDIRGEHIDIEDDGNIFFILDVDGELGKFNAATPFRLNGLTYEGKLSFDGPINSVSFNDDGTRIYTLDGSNNTPILTTVELPNAYDVSSSTQIHQVDLSTLGIEVGEHSSDDQAKDVEFSDDGFAMYILIRNDTLLTDGSSDMPYSYIYQFRLEESFNVATAEKVGRWNVKGFGNNTSASKTGQPTGFSFSSDGMYLFIVQRLGGDGVDQINQFDLECPYGLVECATATTSVIDTTVELAKQNISINTTTIFKRFEWIKRNRDKEDLGAHNINIDYNNPLLDALANKFEPVARKNIASLISNTKDENKKSKWSSWSLVDVFVGEYGQHGSEKPKDVLVKGITLGADRRYGEDKFFGLALRYGDSSSELKNSKQDVTMESLTLNLYGITPTQHNQYVNAVLGVSFLSIDHIYQSKLSGERNGGQIFGSLNYRTKSKVSRFNITPTAKLTYGITHLSEFTDYINNPNDPLIRNLTYKDNDFATGELAAGFLFEMDEYVTDMGTIQPMGGLELLYDLSENIDYKYIHHGQTNIVTDTIRKYSNQDLKYNIGFEAVYLNGFTVSSSFEKIISLNDRKGPNSSREIFILKFSKSKEEDGEFAFNYNPVNAHESSLSYIKNINGFDFSINHNHIFDNSLDYDTNIEVSSTF